MQLHKSFGTHDGSFHADEVSACALLLLFERIDRKKILRSRCQSVLSQCEYVCDVGGVYDPVQKRFDHHQLDYNGPLSSAGMILAFLRDEEDISEELFTFLNDSLIKGVDEHDTGAVTPLVGHCSFSGVIHNFLPVRYDASEEEKERAFYEALDFAYGHIRRLLERFAYLETCKSDVLEAMAENSNVLRFDRALPWMDVFFANGGITHPAQFVLMPSGEHWKLRGIPPSLEERMAVRKPLPEEWAGLLEKDLREKSGIEGAVFCHKGRFISVWKTKRDAEKALELVEGM